MDTKKRNRIWLVGTGVILLVIVVVFAVREFIPTKKVLPAVLDGSVVEIELFEYPYAVDEPDVKRTVISDPVVISEITTFFDGTPVKPFRGSPDLLSGRTATAFRMHLDDGGVVEATYVFIGNYDTVLFWPDGAVYSTTWGRPYDGFYDNLGITEQVPRNLLPVVNF